ncbi:MAG: efflux RND transporter permease subunit [Bacterioplanes sp.]|nr:efflux RND transporter permease subunit [Bacterioplanes sp.]
MRRLLGWFIEHRVAANLAMLCILALGLASLPHLQQELIPNVALDRISIQIPMPGASVNTVQQHLCIPVENAISGLPGGEELISWSYPSLCSITLDITGSVNADSMLADIRSRLANPTLLPTQAETPDVQILRVRNRAVRLVVSATDDASQLSYAELRQEAQQLRRGLLTHNAITDVRLQDHEKPEITIQFSIRDLQRYHLQLQAMNQHLRAQTAAVSGGQLETPDGDILISSSTHYRTVADYAALPITQAGQNDAVPLGHLASLQDTREQATALATFNGRPALAVDVYRTGHADITAISAAVRDYLQRHPPQAGVQITIWQDEAVHFNERVNLLLHNAFSGLILLFIVLLLFLNAHLSFWVGVGIVVSFTGTLMILPVTDTSVNFISLFAFILVLGIVVDDAVVVGEAVYARQEQGFVGQQAALLGVLDVYRPVLFSVITTMIAFTPLLFLPGPEGMLIKAVPIVVITTLFFSLLESLCILPAHLRQVRRSRSSPNRVQQHFSTALHWSVNRLYQPTLIHCMRNPWLVIAGFSATFVLVLVLIIQGWIQSALFSDIEGNVVTATLSFPQGTSRHTTANALQQMATAARRAEAKTGAQAGSQIQNIYQIVAPNLLPSDQNVHRRADHIGQVLLEFPTTTEQPFSAADFIRLWRSEVGTLTGIDTIEYSASVNPKRADLQIEFSGQDQQQLNLAAQRLSDYLHQLDGIYSLQRQPDNNALQLDLQLTTAAQAAGVQRGPILQQINQAFYGQTVQRFYDHDEEVEVRTQLTAADRASIWHLENMPVQINGDTVALKHIGTLTPQTVNPYIRHFMQQPVVMVSAYTDPALNNAERIKKTLYDQVLPELLHDLPGVQWSAGGHQRAVEHFLDLLAQYYGLAILIMYLLMAILFASYFQPLLVLFAIPFGLLGAVAGHLLLGLDLTLWSYVGMVAVSGVVVNDNLVLLDRLNQLRAQQMPLHDALIQACRSRFRPILLTSLTTFAGVLPLLSETSVQAQLLIPMVASLGFGVLFATIISLVLVPALCVVSERLSSRTMTSATLQVSTGK